MFYIADIEVHDQDIDPDMHDKTRVHKGSLLVAKISFKKVIVNLNRFGDTYKNSFNKNKLQL